MNNPGEMSPSSEETKTWDAYDGFSLDNPRNRVRQHKGPFGELVPFYAKVGPHRYNLLEGTDFKLQKLKFYNTKMAPIPRPFYLTLDAYSPASRLKQTFEVEVREKCLCVLDLTCCVARSLSNTPFPARHREPWYDFYNPRLPDWPSQIDFSDRKRFYMAKKSELGKYGWIRFYLKLALVCHSRTLENVQYNMSQLVIVKAAVETIEVVAPPKGSPDAKSIIVYITYKDLGKARIGEPVNRKAIVRRVFDENTGDMALLGHNWSGELARNTGRRSVGLSRVQAEASAD